MSDDRTVHKLVVLYADVSGSTRLYEKHGDAVARHDIRICLDILKGVAEEFGGRLVKTIGDEVECIFPLPHKAAAAAETMHERLREASAGGSFKTGTVRVKIGWHYGVAEWRGANIIGATPAIAQQVIRLAGPEEILASGAAVEMLPDSVSASAQLLDTVESCADGGPLRIFKLPWEDDEDATVFRAPQSAVGNPGYERLLLRHGKHVLKLDQASRHCRIGRIEGNDIVTGSRFTSRHHADISFRQGRFYVADKSVNGTLLVPLDGERQHLHNEEGLLGGEGALVFGNAAGDEAATVYYRCE